MAVNVTREYLLANGVDPETLTRALADQAPTPSRKPVLAIPHGFDITATAEPGRWTATIEGWAPASKNLKKRKFRLWLEARNLDDSALAAWASLGESAPPPAGGRRRVTIAVERRRSNGRLPDPQNLEESAYDSCVNAGLLVDDSARWMDRGPTTVDVNREIKGKWRTRIVLEDCR